MAKLILRGNFLGKIKGILFDKDGTLSDSEKHLLEIGKLRINEIKKIIQKDSPYQYQEEKVSSLLETAYGIKKSILDPHGAIAIASRQDNLITTTTVLTVLGKDWTTALNISQEVFLKVENKLCSCNSNMKIKNLLPGAKKFLEGCQKKEIKCGLISNDSTKGIQEFLQANNIEKNFSGYWSADNKPAKPNPNAVKEFCKVIKLHPSECALIGDSDTDLQMAKAAGIKLALGYVAGWTKIPQLRHQQELIYEWDDLSCQNET